MSNLAPHDSGIPVALEIRRSSPGPEIILALRGELDLGSAPGLEDQLHEVQSARPARVVLDLSGLEFMDSTGLAAVLRAQRRADSDGHELALRRGSSQVQRLFALTGVLERLVFED